MNIGQAAAASGVSAKMLRHYESIGLIPKAGRTEAGYRTYGEAEVHTLRFIKRARDLGLPIERIRLLVGLWRDTHRSSADVKRVATEHVAELRTKIAELTGMCETLEHLGAACHGDHRPEGDDARGDRQRTAVARRELQSGTHMPMLAEPQVATILTGYAHRAQEGS